MRRSPSLLTLCILLSLLLAGLSPVAAQDDAAVWSIFLFDFEARGLIRVDLDGTVTEYDLGISQDTFLNPQAMAFAEGGQFAVFCYFGLAQLPGEATLAVRNLDTGADWITVDMGSVVDCSAGVIDDGGTQVTVATINYFPDDPTTNSGDGGPVWELRVIDVATGDIVATLDATSPAAIEAGMVTMYPILTDVRRFVDGVVTFVEAPYGTGGGALLNSYMWDIEAGTVTRTEGWGFPSATYLDATGELAWIDTDFELSAAEPASLMPAFNVVRVQAPGGEPQIVFHSANDNPVDVVFLDGGARLAVLLQPGFEPEADPAALLLDRWVTVDRGGTVSDLLDEFVFGELVDAPGGPVALETRFEAETITTTLTQYGVGEPRTIWQSERGGWDFVWVTPVVSDAPLGPFTPITP
jgi:hypothetical protein